MGLEKLKSTKTYLCFQQGLAASRFLLVLLSGMIISSRGSNCMASAGVGSKCSEEI